LLRLPHFLEQFRQVSLACRRSLLEAVAFSSGLSHGAPERFNARPALLPRRLKPIYPLLSLALGAATGKTSPACLSWLLRVSGRFWIATR